MRSLRLSSIAYEDREISLLQERTSNAITSNRQKIRAIVKQHTLSNNIQHSFYMLLFFELQLPILYCAFFGFGENYVTVVD